jgi:hypothetical protein
MKIGYTKKDIEKYISKVSELGLTKKQAFFVIEYATNGFNIYQAYLDAGFNPKTRKLGESSARQLLKQDKINSAFKEIINLYLGEKREKMESMIIEQLYQQAFYDIADFVNIDGSPKHQNISEYPKNIRCCIKNIETKYYGKNADIAVTVLDLVDRDKAVDKLSKYIGMFSKDEEESGLRLAKETEELLSKVFSIPIPKEEIIDVIPETITTKEDQKCIDIE